MVDSRRSGGARRSASGGIGSGDRGNTEPVVTQTESAKKVAQAAASQRGAKAASSQPPKQRAAAEAVKKSNHDESTDEVDAPVALEGDGARDSDDSDDSEDEDSDEEGSDTDDSIGNGQRAVAVHKEERAEKKGLAEDPTYRPEEDNVQRGSAGKKRKISSPAPQQLEQSSSESEHGAKGKRRSHGKGKGKGGRTINARQNRRISKSDRQLQSAAASEHRESSAASTTSTQPYPHASIAGLGAVLPGVQVSCNLPATFVAQTLQSIVTDRCCPCRNPRRPRKSLCSRCAATKNLIETRCKSTWM